MTNPAFPPIPANFSTDHLANEITLLAGQINAATHRLLKLIAQFDQRKGWSGGGTVRSCAHWLNWKCGIDLGAALRTIAPDVNAKTAVTRWTGENCDYGMAIHALLQRERSRRHSASSVAASDGN